MDKALMTQQDSLSFWYPRICGMLPTPRTMIVPCDGNLTDHFEATVHAAVERLGGYPVFLRTDQASNKHNYAVASKITAREGLKRAIFDTVWFNECCDEPFGLPYKAVVVREFLTIEHRFLAFNGMPVGKEMRYFARDGKVLCHHPYWPAGAIRDGMHSQPLPADWEALLEDNNRLSPGDEDLLSGYARLFSRQMPPGTAWSVDFAFTSKGWMMIDAARAEQSWHWPDCPIGNQYKME